MIIFLLGYMGSGKTKTGQALAKKLAFDFFDTDQIIEKLEGASIAEIFQSVGEAKFRILEKNTLEEMQAKSNSVISTGGGLPCYFDNMQWMNKIGLTVYLELPVGMLIQRLSQDTGQRPLLNGLNKEELTKKVKEQLKQRETFYKQSKIIFEAADLDLKSLVQQINEFSLK